MKVKHLVRWLAVLPASLLTVWAAAAIAFDFPVTWLRWPLALGFGAFVMATLALTEASRKGFLVWLASVALVAGWWFSLKPANKRAWQTDVAELPWAEIAGDRAKIHNIRNF